MRLPPRLPPATAAALISAFAATYPASADLGDLVPYCIPGVTAARCRGVFWETGKLYKKEPTEAAPMSSAEYGAAIRRLEELRKAVRELRLLAEIGGVGEVGSGAAGARAEVRQLGGRVARALDGDDRRDAEARLRTLTAALGDVDAISLREPDAAGVAPGFSPLRLNLDGASRAFDDFVRGLPAEPADDP